MSPSIRWCVTCWIFLGLGDIADSCGEPDWRLAAVALALSAVVMQWMAISAEWHREED